MTKALFVLHTAAPSGAELAVAGLARALRGAVDVTVVFLQDGPMVGRMRADGVETIVLGSAFGGRAMTIEGRSLRGLVIGLVGLVRLGWTCAPIVHRSGASIVVAHTTKALVVSAVAARRAGVPLVWHTHDRICATYFGGVLAVLVRTLGWVVSDAYIANSRSTLGTLNTWRRRALVAYPCSDLDREARERDQRSPSETVIAVVGRLTRWKGQDVLLRALADVAVRPRRVYIVGGALFGEDAYRSELEALATELELPVVFTGHVDDPVSYMRRADVLVHCSVLAEPFGQVVLQGMSAGCAVIASGPGGPTEIVEAGISGLLVDGGDRAQLTAALDELILDPALRRRLSVAARQRAAHFDDADTARDVAGFLAMVAATSRGRRRAHV
jgi:glycosyltransferase involved in cell wall biosynthesis